MSSSKKKTCKGTWRGKFLSEFIYWRYSQSCWYFRPSFVNCCPSNLLSDSTLPFSTLPSVKVQYSIHRQCVAGRGWRMLSPVGDHILQEFNTVSDQIQSLQICQTHAPHTKTQEGRGPQTDKHLKQNSKNSFTCQFVQMTTFCFGVYLVYQSMRRKDGNRFSKTLTVSRSLSKLLTDTEMGAAT